MKKILYIALSMVTLFSCTNLEPEMYNTINPNMFPTNEKDAEALVTSAAYSPFTSNYFSGIFTVATGGIQLMGDMSTDIGDCQWNDLIWPDVINQNFTPNSRGVTSFYGYVKSISKMTLTIDRIQNLPMKEESKQRMIAELRCARGWMAYLLYDWYGPISIATLEQLKNPLNEVILERPTKEWMANYIETELKESAKVLPPIYGKKSSMYGRFTRGLVNTVLMKLYMHEAQWDKAEAMGRELMKPEYAYQLVPDYKDIFTLENEKNSEIIWACQCDRSTNMQLWLAHVLSSQVPTKNPSIQKWGGYRVPWNFYNTFDKNDKRLKTLVGEFVGTDGLQYSQSKPGSVLIKGALPIKYGEDPVATGEESQIDWVVYRYADVLTELSEAIVRKNNAVNQEAVDLLNSVHVRAGLSAYQLTDFPTVQSFLDKVLEERGKEFWFEGLRRTDLIRHGKYIEYAIKYKGSKTTKKEFELMPLPQSAINEGKGMVIQNVGY